MGRATLMIARRQGEIRAQGWVLRSPGLRLLRLLRRSDCFAYIYAFSFCLPPDY